MGPPTQSPYSFRSRNLTDSSTSEYLVHMPMRAVTHSQNSAPGPPRVTAEVIPAMLPVPTVPARAVDTAWKGVISPSPALVRLKILPKVFRMVKPNFRNCTPLVLSVIRMPTPISRINIGGPQTTLLIAPLILATISILIRFSFSPFAFFSAGRFAACCPMQPPDAHAWNASVSFCCACAHK